MQIPLAFLFGLPGGSEILLIFVVILLMFGPKRLPEMARNLGKAMDYLRRTSQEFHDQIMRLDEEVPKLVDSALKDPVRIDEHTGPAELSPANNEANSTSDPYQHYEDSSMASATPGTEETVLKTEEAQLKEQNAEKTDSNSEGSKEDVSGSQSPGAGSGKELAG